MLDSINKGHFAEGGYTGSLPGLGAWTGAQYEGVQSTADKESARQGIVQLQDAILAKARADLMEVETLLPVIVEQVCSGSVSIRGLDAVP